MPSLPVHPPSTEWLAPPDLPDLPDLLAGARVVCLPLVTPFRGVTAREALLLEGPHGWGEFAPFTEYDDVEASRWLASAIEAAWLPAVPAAREVVPVNATVPAVPPAEVAGVLARFDGCTTAKVKVAHADQHLADDVARVAEVRSLLGPQGRVRVDANGAWDVDQAHRALVALAPFDLEYAEQPCARVDELVDLRVALTRSGIEVPVAADESVRRATDPLRVARAGAADLVVIKVAPLGGVRAGLELAQRLAGDHGLPVVVSSALDTSVGLSRGVALAAALPELPHACGLGTVALLAGDVTSEPLRARGGVVPVRDIRPDAELLARWQAAPQRRRWWLDRTARCLALLAGRGSAARSGRSPGRLLGALGDAARGGLPGNA